MNKVKKLCINIYYFVWRVNVKIVEVFGVEKDVFCRLLIYVEFRDVEVCKKIILSKLNFF